MSSMRTGLALLALAPLLWAAQAEACGALECVRWVDVGPLSFDGGPAPSAASPATQDGGPRPGTVKAADATVEPQDAGPAAPGPTGPARRCVQWGTVHGREEGCSTAAGAPFTLAAAAWLLRGRPPRATRSAGR